MSIILWTYDLVVFYVRKNNKNIMRLKVVDLTRIVLAVIIFLIGIYSIFRTIRHRKEIQKAIKENRSISNMLRKENRILSIEMTIMIILLIIAIFRGR